MAKTAFNGKNPETGKIEFCYISRKWGKKVYKFADGTTVPFKGTKVTLARLGTPSKKDSNSFIA